MKNTAILRISCPDRKGIAAAVAGFLYEHGANILHADQHQDAEYGLFLMRVEWDLADFAIPVPRFEKRFRPVARSFGMDWSLSLSRERPRAAIFVSRQDHCLADLLYRHQSGELGCELPLIISNHDDARRHAEFHGIPFHRIPVRPRGKRHAEAAQLALLESSGVDLVILARYMQVLSPAFVRRFPRRIINIHHSFLPAFHGGRPYHQAFERGVKLIGATSHYVTEKLDDGPIIEQDVIRISHRDAVEDLVQKGRDLEKVVLSRAVRWHLESRILVYGPASRRRTRAAEKTVVFD
jgi:formyltetrahydrofolate deformylase